MKLKKNIEVFSIITLFFFIFSIFPSIVYAEKEAIIGEKNIILFDVSVDTRESAKIRRWITEVLKKSIFFKFKDINTILDTAEEHLQNINYGKENFQKGYDAYVVGNYKDSAKSFKSSLEFFEKSFGYLEFPIQLLDTLIYLSSSLIQLGKDNQSLKYLEKAIIYKREFEYDFSLFPAKVKDLYFEIEQKIKERPLGSIEIITSPPNAELYIDGEFIDITPVRVEGLRSGEHYVVIYKTGYAKWNGIINISPEFERREEIKLQPSKKHRILLDIVDNIKDEMKYETVGETILNLKNIFFSDYALLMDYEKEQGSLNLKFYDLQLKKLINYFYQIFAKHEPFENYENVVVAEIENMLKKEEGKLEELGKPVELAVEKKKEGIFRKWWLWAIVGGTLAAGGVTAVILLGKKEKKPPFSYDGTGAIVIKF